MENSRIIIDPHTFNIHSTLGPGLGSIESDSQMDSADQEYSATNYNVLYKATTQAYREYQKAIGNVENRWEEDVPGGCKPATSSCI